MVNKSRRLCQCRRRQSSRLLPVNSAPPVSGHSRLSCFRLLPLILNLLKDEKRPCQTTRHSLNRGGDFDRMIGATARRHNLTLLSNNRRPFQRSAGRNLISV